LPCDCTSKIGRCSACVTAGCSLPNESKLQSVYLLAGSCAHIPLPQRFNQVLRTPPIAQAPEL
jgi:hypothetical protein